MGSWPGNYEGNRGRLPNAEPVVTLGDLIVGGGTMALALATFWLAFEARKARTEAERREHVRLLRAALAEQLDNLRAWVTSDPAQGEPAFRGIQGAEPRLAALGALIDRLDMPSELTAYLIWLLSSIGDQFGRIDKALEDLPTRWGSNPPALVFDDDTGPYLADQWPVMVELLQVAAALVAAEARRRKIVDVAELHKVVQWTIVPERQERWRELMAISGIPRGEPPFPSNPAYAEVQPEARDRAGLATGARQRKSLGARSHGV